MIIKPFNSISEKQAFLNSLPFRVERANAITRYICLEGWMHSGKECYGFKEQIIDLEVGRGRIEAIEDGCWGWAGDRFAVVINGDRYPSSNVVEASWFNQ